MLASGYRVNVKFYEVTSLEFCHNNLKQSIYSRLFLITNLSIRGTPGKFGCVWWRKSRTLAIRANLLHSCFQKKGSSYPLGFAINCITIFPSTNRFIPNEIKMSASAKLNNLFLAVSRTTKWGTSLRSWFWKKCRLPMGILVYVFFLNTHDFETCSWIFLVYFFPHIYYKIGENIFL